MSDAHLEEVKKLRISRIPVNEVTSQFWCEKQLELRLLLGSDASGDYVTKGANRHDELHREVANLVEAPKTQRLEDSLGLVLHNTLVVAMRLQHEGLTRELFVFGYIDGWFIFGYVDEVLTVGGRTPNRGEENEKNFEETHPCSNVDPQNTGNALLRIAELPPKQSGRCW